MLANVTIPAGPKPAQPAYPRATLRRTGPNTWITDDGYRITRVVRTCEMSAPFTEFHVHVPGSTGVRAVVVFMREAREVICALRKSGNECPNAHLV